MAGFKNKKARTGFNRPVAEAGVEVNREWKHVLPEKVQVGDILSGKGKVVETIGEADCQDQVWILAGYPEAVDYFLDKDVPVFAFVRKDS